MNERVETRPLVVQNTHIWIARLVARPAMLQRSWEILDREERIRAERFQFEIHRNNFILSHGFMREVLGRYLETDPAKIAFRIDRYGKPHLAGIDGLQFNLSESGSLAALAISYGRLVGVDVERIRPIPDLDAMADQCFSESERAVLRALSSTEKEAAFFTFWTRKEAYIKAVGKGLSIPLHSFDTSSELSESSRLIFSRDGPPDIECWWISDLPPIKGYAGAVAVEGRGSGLACWEWRPGE